MSEMTVQDRFRFRAWIKKERRYSWFLNLFNCGKGSNYEVEDYDEQGNHYTMYNPDEVILEQCTGLKDRNGKLIYEGDIIVIPNEYPFYDCKHTDGEPVLNYIGIVKWIYNCWQYEYQCVNPKKSGISNGINNLLNEFGFDDDELSDFEVIGNVHETPELWEK